MDSIGIRIVNSVKKSKSGQVLPVAVLFLGVLVGSAAMAIDVAKLSALRNQAQTAVSAAALAAAQVATQELNGQIVQYHPTPITAAIYSNVDSANSPASQAAISVYHTNIMRAIPNQGLSSNPTITYTVTSSGKLLIKVSASGTTQLSFGRVLGVPLGHVVQSATAEVAAQVGASTQNMLALAFPSVGNSSPPETSLGSTQWQHNMPPGQSFYAYRGDHGTGTVNPPSGSPSGTEVVKFLDVYGSGNDGHIQLPSNMLTTQSSLADASGTGSSYWKTLSSLKSGTVTTIPIGNSYHLNGGGSISIVGFITVTIDSTSQRSTAGTHAGFVFTVDSLSANTPDQQLVGTNSSSFSIGSFGFSLVPN